MQSSNASSHFSAVRQMLIRHGLYAGLAAACGCLVIGGLAWANGASAAGFALATVGIGVAAGWCITWAIYLVTVARPLGRLTEATTALAETDTEALSDALAALAEGDLTRKVEMRAAPIAISATAEVARLGDNIGRIMARLGESAIQLNSMSDEPCRRLFYVGVTRAKQRLDLLRCKFRVMRGKPMPRTPCRAP